MVIGPNLIQGTGNRCGTQVRTTGAVACVVLTLVVQNTTWGLTAVVPQVVTGPSRDPKSGTEPRGGLPLREVRAGPTMA
jgi:hypothetical protein